MKKCILVAMAFFLLFTTGCSFNENVNLDNKNHSENVNLNDSNKEDSKENVYGINDLITLNNESGTMNLKILSVKETNERNEFEEKEYKKVIFIEYWYENVDLDEDFYIDEDNFKVYDKNNTILDTYPLDVSYANAISKGRNATNKIAYGLNSDDNYVEIELRSQSTGKSLNKKIILQW